MNWKRNVVDIINEIKMIELVKILVKGGTTATMILNIVIVVMNWVGIIIIQNL